MASVRDGSADPHGQTSRLPRWSRDRGDCVWEGVRPLQRGKDRTGRSLRIRAEAAMTNPSVDVRLRSLQREGPLMERQIRERSEEQPRSLTQ